MARSNRDSTEAIRITTAAANRADDIRARQKRYLISMSLRTICFVGAWTSFLLGWTWVWPFLVVGALVLPYIAVVMANVAADLSDGFQLREIEQVRPQLEPGHRTGREL